MEYNGDRVATQFGPFVRFLVEVPTLANVLYMLAPSSMDEKMALAEGFILLNNYHAGKYCRISFIILKIF